MVTKRQLLERIAALELKFERERERSKSERAELMQMLDEMRSATATAAKIPTAEEILDEWFNGAEKKK